MSAHLNLALQAHAKGDFMAAQKLYREVLNQDPDNPVALGWLGTIEAQQQNYSEAKFLLERAIKLERHEGFLLSYANLLQEIGQCDGAIAIYEDLLKGKVNVIALSNLAACYNEKGMPREALSYADEALKIDHDYSEAWSNRGNALSVLKRHEEALSSYERAIALNADLAEAWSNRGNALSELKRHDAALASYEGAIELDPDDAETWGNRGNALSELKRHEEALASYDRAIALDAEDAEAWSNRGNALSELKRHEEAVASYDRAIALKSEYAEAWYNRGNALSRFKRRKESARSYLEASRLEEVPTVSLGRAHLQMMLGCDWENYDFYKNKIDDGIERGECVADPFGYQGIAHSEMHLKRCAEIYCARQFPPGGKLCPTEGHSNKKIKIGYLCGEFRNQATSHLMTGVWELHDRSEFELHGFDSGWGDDSDYRKRIRSAFENFSDISKLTDLKAAQLILQNKIDILVNLNGYFGQARQGVFALKPAPIQVNYLGFPGTIGATYIDYLVADKTVIPETSREHYTEKIIYLPFSYQANDNRKEISSRKISRSEFGLPEDSFIFCCFNSTYKITPQIFDIWMDILKKIEKSCLWLLEDNEDAERNLRMEAKNRGVNPERLIFARRLKLPEHINRQRLADLFLDTLPYNAHTTASDALWSGLPVITLKGTTFPGRVGASLLGAIGLPELITSSIEEYKRLAISLAKNPDKLADIKKRLLENRLTAPLFDTSQFARHLESAFGIIYRRHQAGLAPDHISIDS